VLDRDECPGAGEADIAHVADVKIPTPLRTARCSLTMPQRWRRDIRRHIPAVELDHLRTHLAMDGIQRSFTDWWRAMCATDKKTSIDSGWAAESGTD